MKEVLSNCHGCRRTNGLNQISDQRHALSFYTDTVMNKMKLLYIYIHTTSLVIEILKVKVLRPSRGCHEESWVGKCKSYLEFFCYNSQALLRRWKKVTKPKSVRISFVLFNKLTTELGWWLWSFPCLTYSSNILWLHCRLTLDFSILGQ